MIWEIQVARDNIHENIIEEQLNFYNIWHFNVDFDNDHISLP